jgi:LacI family transcriptional regulator
MKPRPDAVFTSNDTTAVTVMVEIQEAGLDIPNDIAVVGFNNEPSSRIIRPNLTSIDYPAREVGEVAATALINKLKNPQSVSLKTILLNHSLIIRQSSLRNG